MPELIGQRMAHISDKTDAKELMALYNAVLTDLTRLRTAITTLTAKLDADVGVTDTNYATLCNPAALETRA